jgi:hypothetical protein
MGSSQRERRVVEALLRVWSYSTLPPSVSKVRFEDELRSELSPPPDAAIEVDGKPHFVEVTDCELFSDQGKHEQDLTQFCFELRRALRKSYSPDDLAKWFPRYEKEPDSYRSERYSAFLDDLVPEICSLIETKPWKTRQWQVPRTKLTLRFSASPTKRSPWITCWSLFDYDTTEVMKERLTAKSSKMRHLSKFEAVHTLILDTQFCGYLAGDKAYREAFSNMDADTLSEALDVFSNIYLAYDVDQETYILPLAFRHKVAPSTVYTEWFRIQHQHLFYPEPP